MDNDKRIPFPQRPSDYTERYDDAPDWGKCPDCPNCGVTMGYNYFKDAFKCPKCGRIIDAYEAVALLADEDKDDEDEKPFVCRTCGGPWPDCRTSCKMFDD